MKAIVEFMYARFIALGRLGANSDVKSQYRKEWEELRADLQKLGVL